MKITPLFRESMEQGFPVFISYEKTAAALEECGYTVEMAREKWNRDWEIGDPNTLMKDHFEFWLNLREKLQEEIDESQKENSQTQEET